MLYIRPIIASRHAEEDGEVLAMAAHGTACATGREWVSEAELQDLLGARQRLLDAGDAGPASSLSEVICARLRNQGDLGEAAALCESTLAAMPSPSASRARWLQERGTIARLRGESPQARDWYVRAVRMFAEIGDAAGVARGYESLGVLAHAGGDYQHAEHYYQAAACFRDPPPPPAAGEPAPPEPPAPAGASALPAQAELPALAEPPALPAQAELSAVAEPPNMA
jgi:tetratricopeptide (TPR) repeat protein